MRTFHIAALAMLAAVSESVVAHSMMESFDTSILNARSGLPNTVPMVARAANNDNNSSLKMQRRSEMVRVTKKREEGTFAMAADVQKRGDDGADEECEADEDDSNDDEEEDCEEEDDDGEDDEDCDEEDASNNNDKSSDAPVLPTSSIRNAAAVVPSSTSAPAPPSTAVPAPTAGGDKTNGPVQKPSNIADESFTPSEGCIRYHTVLEGEVCLGVLDGSKDLGLTLDQFYCLNPGIKEGCSNLTTGKAYCTGYSGEWPQ